jgi:hypothetical protein
MSDYEERRAARYKYEADVSYDVWRWGGNPDSINLDRIDDCYYDGHEPEYAAGEELRIQRDLRARAEEGSGDE